MEVWKDIPGYEGKYQVSNLGRIKSLNYNREKREKVLKLHQCKKGYVETKLSKGSIAKTFHVHVLVAKVFIPNPDHKSEVNHKNGDKTDNRTDNLEWVTHHDNIIHSHETGLAGHYTRRVLQYDKCGNLLKEWVSAQEAEKETCVHHTNIAACCKGRRFFAGGYIWRYKEAE